MQQDKVKGKILVTLPLSTVTIQERNLNKSTIFSDRNDLSLYLLQSETANGIGVINQLLVIRSLNDGDLSLDLARASEDVVGISIPTNHESNPVFGVLVKGETSRRWQNAIYPELPIREGTQHILLYINLSFARYVPIFSLLISNVREWPFGEVGFGLDLLTQTDQDMFWSCLSTLRTRRKSIETITLDSDSDDEVILPRNPTLLRSFSRKSRTNSLPTIDADGEEAPVASYEREFQRLIVEGEIRLRVIEGDEGRERLEATTSRAITRSIPTTSTRQPPPLNTNKMFAISKSHFSKSTITPRAFNKRRLNEEEEELGVDAEGEDEVGTDKAVTPPQKRSKKRSKNTPTISSVATDSTTQTSAQPLHGEDIPRSKIPRSAKAFVEETNPYAWLDEEILEEKRLLEVREAAMILNGQLTRSSKKRKGGDSDSESEYEDEDEGGNSYSRSDAGSKRRKA